MRAANLKPNFHQGGLFLLIATDLFQHTRKGNVIVKLIDRLQAASLELIRKGATQAILALPCQAKPSHGNRSRTFAASSP